MLQSWRQCSTYATSLNTLHYFGMLILAVFPRGRKSPELYNRKCRKNVQTVFYSDRATKLEPNVFLNIYWNKVVPVHANEIAWGGGEGERSCSSTNSSTPDEGDWSSSFLGHFAHGESSPPPTEYENGWVPNRRTGRYRQVVNPLLIPGI
jgi:hypothetical protein